VHLIKYSPGEQIKKRKRWEGHMARMGDKKGAYRVLMGNPEGKRPLGRPISLSLRLRHY
jgi:ribosomal protein L34